MLSFDALVTSVRTIAVDLKIISRLGVDFVPVTCQFRSSVRESNAKRTF